MARLDGLYPLADAGLRRDLSMLDKVDGLLAGGARVIQLRMKHEPAGVVLAVAREAVKRCHAVGALLLIDDRADLCVLAGADGVHVGAEDLPVAAARALVGSERLVGATVRTLEEARRAAAEGACHVGFGPLFGTRTKQLDVAPRGLPMLAEVVAGSPVPVVAIGGIDLARIGSVAATGVRAAAVVSAALEAPEIPAAVAALAAAFAEGRAEAGRTVTR